MKRQARGKWFGWVGFGCVLCTASCRDALGLSGLRFEDSEGGTSTNTSHNDSGSVDPDAGVPRDSDASPGGNDDGNPNGGVDAAPDMPPPCFLDVTRLDEEFSDTSRFASELEADCWGSWGMKEAVFYGVDESESVLRIIPQNNTSWATGPGGPLFYRAVKGDFVVETEVVVTDSDDPDNPPRQAYSGGGLLIIDPATLSSQQRLLYEIQTGTLGDGQTGVKYGTNVDLWEDDVPGPSNRLRFCRLGRLIYALHAPLGSDDWSSTTFEFESWPGVELPPRVYVGVFASQWSREGGPVTLAEFSHFRLRTDVQSPGDCLAAIE